LTVFTRRFALYKYGKLIRALAVKMSPAYLIGIAIGAYSAAATEIYLYVRTHKKHMNLEEGSYKETIIFQHDAGTTSY